MQRFVDGNVQRWRLVVCQYLAALRVRPLRWGLGVGVVYPSRVGPLALEIGWRDDGGSLLSASLGWN